MKKNPAQVFGYYYAFLVEHMDADSVSHLMLTNNFITDDEFEAISSAPNDVKMNCLLLQFMKLMKVSTLMKFYQLLQKLETQKNVCDVLLCGKQHFYWC